MLKAHAKNLMLLGLTDGNIEHLMSGEPLKIDATALGFPGLTIAIFRGRNDRIMTEALAKALNIPTAGVEMMAAITKAKQP